LYAKAEEEYDSGKINKGLWSQALVKAKGDEKLRKIEYMKLRVKHLKRSH
jgi:D-alanyl-D-alanine carboxypeptidase